MKKFIKEVDLICWLVVLLILCQMGSYSQLLFPEAWVKLRDMLFGQVTTQPNIFSIPFYYLYWVVTIVAILVVLFVLILIVGKLIVRVGERKKK